MINFVMQILPHKKVFKKLIMHSKINPKKVEKKINKIEQKPYSSSKKLIKLKTSGGKEGGGGGKRRKGRWERRVHVHECEMAEHTPIKPAPGIKEGIMTLDDTDMKNQYVVIMNYLYR